MKTPNITTKYLFVIFAPLLSGCFNMQSGAHANFNTKSLLQEQNIMPIAIIGSGPAGLMAGLYGARGGKPTYIFEGNKPGGLLMDTTEVENWPGEVSIKGSEIIDKLKQQAEHQGAQFVQDAIERVDFSRWPYRLYTENGDTVNALSVVIATGASPKRLYVPGEDQYWGSGVTSCAVCDAPFFKNEEVVVVGGGDSAAEEAMQLAPYASKITILVRKGEMRAAVSMQERLKQYDKINIMYNVEIKRITGDDTNVKAVELYNNKTKETFEFATAGVFLAVGHNPNSGVFKDAIDVNDEGYIKVMGRTQQTSVEGVFAAGDIHDHRYRQAGSSAGFGIDAGLDAVKFLDEIGINPRVMKELEPRVYGMSNEKSASILRSAQPSEAGTNVNVHTITNNEDFDVLLASTDNPVILDFWAETCPSCKQMLPVLDVVAEEYSNRATFAKVDVDEAEDVIERLHVNKVPCILVFQGGALVARHNDAMSRKELTQFVNKFIS